MVTIRFNPTIAHSNDESCIRLLERVNKGEAIQGRLLEIKLVKLVRSFLGFHLYKTVGKEFYFNPCKKIVNTETQRFVDMHTNADNPYINAWWKIRGSFEDFFAQQHHISVEAHVRFKDPLFPVLNNFAIK